MSRTIYRNDRNENKYLDVVRYADGHNYVDQYMAWGSVVNYNGGKMGRRHRRRVNKRLLNEILADYTEVIG